MARDGTTSPIRLQDIEAMEARGIRREIVDGQWIQRSEDGMAGELHGAIATHLIPALGTYVKAHQLGRIYSADRQRHRGM